MRLTWDHTRFLALLQRLKIVGVSSTASVFKQFAVSFVDVEEESVFDRLAWAFFILQCAKFIEDQVVGVCSFCWGGTEIFRMCVHACLGQSKFSHQRSKSRKWCGKMMHSYNFQMLSDILEATLLIRTSHSGRWVVCFLNLSWCEECIWSIHAGVNILLNTRQSLASLALIKAAHGRSRSTLT